MFIVVSSLFSVDVFAYEFDRTGVVSSVIDGDTFWVDSNYKVRLADVNTPEIGEVGADEATQYVSDLILGKNVYLDVDDVYETDWYGRYVCVAYVELVNGQYLNLNEGLLRKELAEIMDYTNEFDPYSWEYIVGEESVRPSLEEWSHFYGDNWYSEEIIETSDGNYAIVGSDYSNPVSDILFLKLDINGSILSSNSFGGQHYDYGSSLIETPDGGFLLTGYSLSYSESVDVIVIKTDSDGNELWVKAYPIEKSQRGYSICSTSDEGYVIAGQGQDNTTEIEYESIFLMKIDSSGTPIWNYTYPSLAGSRGFSVKETQEGDLLVTGYIDTHTYEEQNQIILLKTDVNGSIAWYETFGGEESEIGWDIEISSDNEYMLVGESNSLVPENPDVIVIKTDSEGNEIWRTYHEGIDTPSREIGFSIDETNEGDFIVCGRRSYIEKDINHNIFVLKLDSQGNKIWRRDLGGDGMDEAKSIISSSGGGFVLTGYYESMSPESLFVMKIKDETPPPVNFTVRVSIQGKGALNYDSGLHSFSEDTTIPFEAYPENNWVLAYWYYNEAVTGNSIEGNNIFNYTVVSNVEITAVFMHNQSWYENFGGSENEKGRSIIEANDGYLMAIGSTSSFGFGGNDIYVVKTYPDGTMVWEKTFGGYNDDNGVSIDKTSDGCYLLLGTTYSFGTGESDYYLIKIDEEGNEIWSKTYGGVLHSYATNLLSTKDNGFIIIGYSQSFGEGHYDIYIVRCDSSGNIIWDNSYGGSNRDIGFDIIQTADEGFVVIGTTESFGVEHESLYLFKIDGTGNLLWETIDQSDSSSDGSSVMEDHRGKIVATGAMNGDVYLVKYNSTGSHMWNHTFGGDSSDNGFSISQTENGYLITGSTSSFGLGSDDIWILLTDYEGNLISNFTWGKYGGERCYDHIVTSGGNLVLTGYSYPNTGGTSDLLILSSKGTFFISTTYVLELTSGWNMVSLPVDPQDASASTILGNVGFYQLITWSGSGYISATSFEAGRGYWLLVLEDVNVTVSGEPVDSLILSLSAGWSMVGGTYGEVQAADVFPGFYQLVTWTGTGYIPATVFEPGRGYWALVLAETPIQLPPT